MKPTFKEAIAIWTLTLFMLGVLMTVLTGKPAIVLVGCLGFWIVGVLGIWTDY